MAADYYTLLTNAGLAYETACKAKGQPIILSKMSVGDGNGAVYNPDATATALKREVWRGDLNALLVDSSNPNWLVAELTIPNEVGGWYVREAAIWTDTGILYAVIKYPESYKPVLATSGAGKEFYLRAIFQTSNAANVTLSIDENVVKATRSWVADYVASEINKLDAKKSVRVVATSAITLSGAQLIDSVAVVAGDRVLNAPTVATKDAGIWIVANGPWQRAQDADINAEVTPGLFVTVEEGTVYGDSLWQLVNNAPIVVGTTALSFEMLAGKTGIGAGTYRSLTVDKYGRVIAGTNPTTIAGYGIEFATQAEAEAGIEASKPMNALRVMQAIAKIAVQATGAIPGILRTATAGAITEGTDDTTAVTPAGLSQRLSALLVQATESTFGWLKVATQAQVSAGTDDTTVVTPKKLSAYLVQATESVFGWLKVATQAQTNSGADDKTVVTPKKLRAGFSLNLASIGYIVFPTWMGGLIIQWGSLAIAGSNSANLTLLPIAWTNGFLQGVAAFSGAANASATIGIDGASGSKTQINLYQSSAGGLNVRFIVVGY